MPPSRSVTFGIMTTRKNDTIVSDQPPNRRASQAGNHPVERDWLWVRSQTGTGPQRILPTGDVVGIRRRPIHHRDQADRELRPLIRVLTCPNDDVTDYFVRYPQSTRISRPVTYLDSSDANHSAAAAISDGSTQGTGRRCMASKFARVSSRVGLSISGRNRS